MGAVAISLILVALSSFQTYKISNEFQSGVVTNFRLQQLSGQIIHLDEVLTMSSRMAAATGDLAWEERYRAYEPALSENIGQAIAIAPDAYDRHADQINEAHLKRVEIENQAFELVEKGDKKEALTLLFGESYQTQKERYASGIQQWTQLLDNRIQGDLKRYGRGLFWSGVRSMTSLWILIIAWVTLLSRIGQYLYRQKAAEKGLRRANRQLEIDHHELEQTQASLQHKTLALDKAHTELEHAQRQIVESAKMSSLGRLVAGITDEMSHPLQAIDTSLSTVRTQVTHFADHSNLSNPHRLTQELSERLAQMQTNAQNAQKMVLSLCNLAHADEADKTSVDIHAGLDAALLLLHHRLAGTDNRPKISVVRNYGVLPSLKGYPGQLQQVFINLISNAIDAINASASISEHQTQESSDESHQAGENHQIRVRTVAFRDPFDMPWIEVSVADTGVGIPEVNQDKILEAFFTTKPANKGTGIGLSISYATISEKHNGRLTFTSIEGEGSEFIVQLPVTLATQTDPSQPVPAIKGELDRPPADPSEQSQEQPQTENAR
ncbi:MAG: HAMP domain-containing sensor histidine kinase [Phormidesmis sp.]